MQDIILVFARFLPKTGGRRRFLARKGRFAGLLLAIFSLVCVQALAAPVATQKGAGSFRAAKIAIVIDDLGNQPALDEAFIHLPGPVALAFLPNAPATRALAQAAHQAGKPVLLHLPMTGSDALHAEHSRLDAGMNRQALLAFVRKAIQQVPFLEGINNHQGSDLTRRAQPMQWLMQELAAYPGLYFLDSRTSAESVAETMARRYGVPSARRHVFLDNQETVEAIRHQLQRLAHIAHREGAAIAIGHPNRATLEALQELPSWLAEQRLQLVSPAQLVHR